MVPSRLDAVYHQLAGTLLFGHNRKLHRTETCTSRPVPRERLVPSPGALPDIDGGDHALAAEPGGALFHETGDLQGGYTL